MSYATNVANIVSTLFSNRTVALARDIATITPLPGLPGRSTTLFRSAGTGEELSIHFTSFYFICFQNFVDAMYGIFSRFNAMHMLSCAPAIQ